MWKLLYREKGTSCIGIMIFYLCITEERSWKQIYSNINIRYVYVYVVLGRCRSYLMINMFLLGKGENEWKRKEYPDIPNQPILKSRAQSC